MSAEAYSVDEVAEILDCSTETAAERIACGDLPGIRFGRGWIVPKEAFSRRLNDLALEQAQERRKGREAISASAQAIKTAQQPPRKAGQRARTPPQLPAP